MKRTKYVLLLSLCLLLTACGPKPAETAALDLDYIADTLFDSGYFPHPLEEQDPELVPGLLSLYEDRIEANPEDIAQARYTMSLGMVADQFLLLEGTDETAAGRLEQALATYAEDQKSAYEFYAPDQAARLDDPIIVRQGNYLLFAVGGDRDKLEQLCEKLMAGETVELPEMPDTPDVSEPDVSAPDVSQPEGPPVTGPSTPFTEEELDQARQAALDYYSGTVFDVAELHGRGLDRGKRGILTPHSLQHQADPQTEPLPIIVKGPPFLLFSFQLEETVYKFVPEHLPYLIPFSAELFVQFLLRFAPFRGNIVFIVENFTQYVFHSAPPHRYSKKVPSGAIIVPF